MRHPGFKTGIARSFFNSDQSPEGLFYSSPLALHDSFPLSYSNLLCCMPREQTGHFLKKSAHITKNSFTSEGFNKNSSKKYVLRLWKWPTHTYRFVLHGITRHPPCVLISTLSFCSPQKAETAVTAKCLCWHLRTRKNRPPPNICEECITSKIKVRKRNYGKYTSVHPVPW